MNSVWRSECSRQVTGQADIIAYGSQSVGGGTDGVDAEAICVTCADHTPGEEVIFDPLGKVQCLRWLPARRFGILSVEFQTVVCPALGR